MEFNNGLTLTWTTCIIQYGISVVTISTWPIALTKVFTGGGMSTERAFTGLVNDNVNCGAWSGSGQIVGSGAPACTVLMFKIGI